MARAFAHSVASLCYLPGLVAHVAFAIVSFALVVALGVPGLYLATGVATVLYLAAIRGAFVAGGDGRNDRSGRFHSRQSAIVSLGLLVYAVAIRAAMAAVVGATLAWWEGLALLVFLLAFADLVVTVAAAAGWGMLVVQSSRSKHLMLPVIGRLAAQAQPQDRVPGFERVTRRAA
jgi:uncharacterized membrane protein